MLIRSQDRKTLTKFDFINIYPSENLAMYNLDENESVEMVAFVGHRINVIGEYSTEEKAKKVLDMIEEHQIKATTSSLDFRDGTLSSNTECVENIVFQMPQDDEVEV